MAMDNEYRDWLISRALKFHIGYFEIDSLGGNPPLYLEKDGKGWVLRAEHPNTMNPHYLWVTPDANAEWHYKHGCKFKSIEEAMGWFQQWQKSVEEEGGVENRRKRYLNKEKETAKP